MESSREEDEEKGRQDCFKPIEDFPQEESKSIKDSPSRAIAINNEMVRRSEEFSEPLKDLTFNTSQEKIEEIS